MVGQTWMGMVGRTRMSVDEGGWARQGCQSNGDGHGRLNGDGRHWSNGDGWMGTKCGWVWIGADGIGMDGIGTDGPDRRGWAWMGQIGKDGHGWAR